MVLTRLWTGVLAGSTRPNCAPHPVSTRDVVIRPIQSAGAIAGRGSLVIDVEIDSTFARAEFPGQVVVTVDRGVSPARVRLSEQVVVTRGGGDFA